MLNFFSYKKKFGETIVETSFKGKSLLNLPPLNKGTSFSFEERVKFNLLGKLPDQVESLEQQKERILVQYKLCSSDIDKYIFLRRIHDRNETLFYSFIKDHLDEMLPIIYTPTVGEAVQRYSLDFCAPRGLYISYRNRYRIKEILQNRTNKDIDLIVATDAEGVLGIGDQGVGGIEIPVAKLKVYTICGGLNPGRYLPVFLDAGTNNQELLDNPLYLGWRHSRISRDKYDEMLSLFVKAVKEEFEDVYLHWEDFGRDNARRNLLKYENEICSFNDDMQGTAAVVVAALLSACNEANLNFGNQKIVIFGSGTAGLGIADEIVRVMIEQYNVPKKDVYGKFWCFDRDGLILSSDKNIPDFQVPYAKSSEEIEGLTKDKNGRIQLLEVIKKEKPTSIIGSSGVANSFTDEVILEMAKNNERPIILPISNPTTKCERHPEDIIRLTQGKVLLATGSPFNPIGYKGKVYRVAQCNNALIFPGIGLGVIAMKCSKLTENMLWVACKTLAEFEVTDKGLLPPLREAYNVSRKVAFAVALQSVKDGVTKFKSQDIWERINDTVWEPRYYGYELVDNKE